jgi:hypothetical protein
MSSYIQITRRTTLEADNRHRLRVWVSETSDNLPPTIFVYQRLPSVPSYDALSDIFVHVASYADIADYPENDPGDDSPFFRKYHIDLIFTSLPHLSDTWDLIEGQVKHTVEDLARLNGDEAVDVTIVDC